MTAFVPISPAAARRILDGVSPAGEGEFLSAFVEAGLIRAYAAVIETLDASGGLVRHYDKRIATAVWRRIVAEGKLEQALMLGSVRMEGDGLVGGRAAVMITGIRFNQANVHKVAAEHGPTPAAPSATPPSISAKAPIPKTAEPALSDAPPLIEVPQPATVRVRRGLAADEIQVSVSEAMQILNVSRPTLYKYADEGKLAMKKVGGRTFVIAESIRAMLGLPN